ncbi:MAG: alanine racemase [Spirochaetales bacterium]|nr:alanine racemase [Spirochaetales bacterium]
MSSLVWVELDGAAPDHNLRELRKGLRRGTRVCAVVKANAYGHGVREIARLVPSADWLAVNSLEEGAELRSLGERRRILVLGHVPLGRLGEAASLGLDLTLYNRESLAALQEMGRASGSSERLQVHLKVETGTGRQGVLPEDVGDFLARLDDIPGVELAGVSTHFANVEDTLNHGYAQGQLERFQRVVATLRRGRGRLPLSHTASTAAAILLPETHFDMVRVGIGLYGLWPSRETFLSRVTGRRPVPQLRPVLSWKTRIAQIKTLPEGSYVGYGCTYRTTRTTRLGVLPVGYADGYDRALGNTAHVLVQGRRAPVIGRICMNLTMVDLTDIPRAALEEEVVLLGSDGEERISAEKLAEWAGTINYEIVTRISPLLERRVIGAPQVAPTRGRRRP